MREYDRISIRQEVQRIKEELKQDEQRMGVIQSLVGDVAGTGGYQMQGMPTSLVVSPSFTIGSGSGGAANEQQEEVLRKVGNLERMVEELTKKVGEWHDQSSTQQLLPTRQTTERQVSPRRPYPSPHYPRHEYNQQQQTPPPTQILRPPPLQHTVPAPLPQQISTVNAHDILESIEQLVKNAGGNSPGSGVGPQVYQQHQPVAAQYAYEFRHTMGAPTRDPSPERVYLQGLKLEGQSSEESFTEPTESDGENTKKLEGLQRRLSVLEKEAEGAGFDATFAAVQQQLQATDVKRRLSGSTLGTSSAPRKPPSTPHKPATDMYAAIQRQLNKPGHDTASRTSRASRVSKFK
eukprot:TRINITY_DN2198_c1_g2_i1.p1 TRINITY_DN2198_c1_g2~~TRINITY_DN2198_c1_g2_i1.p1  ORF type:complete len:367 (+),score=72.52 TRINITY_DN2198_c1_g2_i1:56-1102(+)